MDDLLDENTDSLPPAPSTICFNKDEFIKENYNLDKFVSDVRRHSSLETVREDLITYMKILQSALVELINRDYADFVNLSSNLVGMDKIISNISEPLTCFQSHVLELHSLIQEKINMVRKKLEKRSCIREKKKSLQYLEGILSCVGTMESILESSTAKTESGENLLESHLVERISTEFNQLQFFVSKCKGFELVENVKPRINRITQVLQQNLEGMFVEGFQRSNEELLTRCLRTYITIDKISDAESLFRRTQVSAYMTDFINDLYIKQKGGSFAMYAKILEFKQQRCTVLSNVLKAKSGQEPLKGFDFMVNSVWPEVVELLDGKASSVFAPGNPDKFYKEYQDAMEFLSNFESQCGTKQSVERLRNHSCYEKFISKWSLPVYFQIRLQEIAGSMEKGYLCPWAVCETPSDFKFNLVNLVLLSVKKCWSDGVYITSLSHRFWKLTLQIMSRFTIFLAAVADGKVEVEVPVEKITPKTLPRIEAVKTEGRSSPAMRSESPSPLPEMRKPGSSELVSLLSDSLALLPQLNSFLSDRINTLSDDAQRRGLLIMALNDGSQRITDQLSKIQQLIVDELLLMVAPLLKQVCDIPRLYRRTNREVPSKTSSYMHNATQLLLTFKEQNGKALPSDVIQGLFANVISKLLVQYEELSCEVLLSVKKMEDSLKRLKRGKTTTNLPGNMSDDDKIRTQISLDVNYFVTQVSLLGIDIESNSSYQKLKTDVDQALKNQDQGDDINKNI